MSAGANVLVAGTAVFKGGAQHYASNIAALRVDPRPAQLLERDRLQAGHPPRRVVPDRPDAEQRQHLGDVVPGGPHRRRAPHRQPDRRRELAACRPGSASTSDSAIAWPVSQASRDGIARGSTE